MSHPTLPCPCGARHGGGPHALSVDPEVKRSVLTRLRRVLALRAELGEAAAPATTEVSDDPVLATYQASILAPCGPADHHRLLSVPGPAARRRLLDELLGEHEELLAFQLGEAGESPE